MQIAPSPSIRVLTTHSTIHPVLTTHSTIHPVLTTHSTIHPVLTTHSTMPTMNSCHATLQVDAEVKAKAEGLIAAALSASVNPVPPTDAANNSTSPITESAPAPASTPASTPAPTPAPVAPTEAAAGSLIFAEVANRITPDHVAQVGGIFHLIVNNKEGVYGARFRTEVCTRECLWIPRIPLGSPLALTVAIINHVETLKASRRMGAGHEKWQRFHHKFWPTSRCRSVYHHCP
jgi:hypothetical protein